MAATARALGVMLLLALAAGRAGAGLADDWNACLAQRLDRPDRNDRTDAFAQYCIGLTFLRGHNTRQDYRQAAQWFGNAAARNHGGALAALGYLHENGKGVPADPKRAADFYRRSAEQGNDEGLYYFGRALAHGIGIDTDRVRAATYLRQAADRGHYLARQELAELQRTDRPHPAEPAWAEGVRRFQANDPAGAFRQFLTAAQAGHVLAQGQVGFHYEKGLGVPKDDALAVQWYRKAALAGDSRAQKNLGQMYELGQGVAEDWVQAAKWYEQSAAQGDPEGNDALGRAYQYGIGVPQNRSKAIELFRKAAAQGNGDAQYWARWLSDPTNNIGFRNAREHQLVIGDRLRTAGELLGADPAGIAFRNSRERIAWLTGLRERVDRSEAMTRWEHERQRYDQCQRTGGRGCIDPGPRPR